MAAKAKQADANPDDEQEGEKPPAKPKKKISRKMMIIAAGGLLVVVGGGIGGYLFFGHANHEKAAKTEVKPATFVDMPDVLVNLANAPGSDRVQYLKVKIVLELRNASEVQQIQPLMPRVMDAFQTYLRELRPTDLDGSAGLYRLKEELTRRVNAAVAPNRITAVLFKEIVVQ
jgi:flagellar FliL protein